jgi:H+/Cl- antiporter ClcA
VAVLAWVVHWLMLAVPIGGAAGLASAAFLLSLDWVTAQREAHPGLILCLPGAGFLIGWTYHHYGREANAGNNAVLEQWQRPTRILSWRMIPLVLGGTLLTHGAGGSAGREGTAVQMGAALADQVAGWLGLRRHDRRVVLSMGVSAGFASVFGTPLAGAVFALEVMVIGRLRYEALLPSVLAAAIADGTCRACGVGHVHYAIGALPDLSFGVMAWSAVVGMVCGLVAMGFATLSHRVQAAFAWAITYPPLRPVAGGLLLVGLIWLLGTTRYIGLGIPVIEEAFVQPIEPYAFVVKIGLTVLTLAAGFKGGEVTPLFFIGATLGNALFGIVPLPLGLLAALGFVAVFAGATHTPLACTLLGIELFGHEAGLLLALATVTAYTFSGHTGIYPAQILGSRKHAAARHQPSRE